MEIKINKNYKRAVSNSHIAFSYAYVKYYPTNFSDRGFRDVFGATIRRKIEELNTLNFEPDDYFTRI